jgi:hypothetical protein
MITAVIRIKLCKVPKIRAFHQRPCAADEIDTRRETCRTENHIANSPEQLIAIKWAAFEKQSKRYPWFKWCSDMVKVMMSIPGIAQRKVS